MKPRRWGSRTRAPNHPLLAVFEAKDVDDLRRKHAMDALSAWMAGTLPFVELQRILSEWQETQTALIASVVANREYVATPDPKAAGRIFQDVVAASRS